MNNLICQLFGIVEAIKIPLTIGAITIVALSYIGAPIFPEAAQRNQQALRTIIIGLVLLIGATWVASIFFGDVAIGC